MEYLALFLEWLKVALAKSTLFIIFGTLFAVFLAYLTDKILIQDVVFECVKDKLNIEKLEYWLFLFVTFMFIVIGIRIVEIVIKTVLIKKEPKKE